MAIIFVVCVSILSLIFIPKVRASKKPRVKKRHGSHSTGGNEVSRTSSTNDSESSGTGIKILSSPKAIAELEEENRKLKDLVTGSGRRLSSVLNDPEEGSRRPSHISNDSIAESDAVIEKEKRVTFEGASHGDIEKCTEMNTVDEEGGDIEEEGNADEGKSHAEMNVVDIEKGVDEEDNEKDEKIDDQVQIGN